jgi:prevent-host-death family protein
MLTVNIHEAKTHLSRLLDRAARGEPFIIAKAGKPLVKVVPLETPEAGQVRRFGFMTGQMRGPTISTGWERPRSSAFSETTAETAAGYATAAVGCRAAGALAGGGSHGHRRRSRPADVQRGEPVGSRDQIRPRPRRFSRRRAAPAPRPVGQRLRRAGNHWASTPPRSIHKDHSIASSSRNRQSKASYC